MTSTKTRSAWDFAPVFDLIQSLKINDEDQASAENSSDAKSKQIKDHDAGGSTSRELPQGLGNFNELWDYLGVQRDAQPPAAPHFGVSTLGDDDAQSKDAYASDGAIYYPASSKNVKWRDGDGHDLTDVQALNPQEPQLNKNQRKKKNRKLRKAAEVSKVAPHRSRSTQGDSSGDAADVENSPPRHPPPTAPVKNGANDSNTDGRYALRSTIQPRKHGRDESLSSTLVSDKEDPAASKQTPCPIAFKATKDTIKEAREKVAAATLRDPQTTPRKATESSNVIHESLRKQWPVADPYSSYLATPVRPARNSMNQPPQTEPPKMKSKAPSPRPEQASANYGLPRPGPVQTNSMSASSAQISTPSQGKRHEIQPLLNQTSIDRNWSLFLKVLHNFPQDRQYLVSPLQLSINRPSPSGIHVFVDASNIMIGFMEHLKRARGISQYARVPRVELNFHALALLLERRRPVTKRVLAGSTPEVPAFEEARQVGYETCILDKVYKARELTERKKFFEGYTSGNGSDANAQPVLEKAKWIEQAVDEILHLKICESVIDTTIPADVHAGNTASARPTMVVATGDAAEAEYSPGFLKMVERALEKGWNVEVIAFGRSVSMGYRRMERLPMDRGGWGERFKIIELDDYAEELFGETM